MSRFLVIGDATLDVTVAPARRPRRAGDVPAVIRFGPGGQGANVAVRLARRGVGVALLAAIGTDAAGRLLAETLDQEGVRLTAPPGGRSAAVVALLDPAGERSMLSDRQPLPPAGADPIQGASWVHASAYPLLADGEGDELAMLLAARPEEVRLSVAGGSIPPDAPVVARFRQRLERCRPQLLVVSRDEAAALLDSTPDPASRAARGLAPLAPLVIVTAGEQGSAACIGGRVLEVDAVAADGPVVDATGSGDAYLAALIRELEPAAWPPPDDALRRAMELASLCGALTSRVPGAQGRINGEISTAEARA